MEAVAIVLFLATISLVARNAQLAFENRKLKKTISTLSNATFRQNVTPYELVVYYSYLYRQARLRSKEYEAALRTLYDSTRNAQHMFFHWDQLMKQYSDRKIFTKPWENKDAYLPYLNLHEIKENESEFRKAYNSAIKDIQS